VIVTLPLPIGCAPVRRRHGGAWVRAREDPTGADSQPGRAGTGGPTSRPWVIWGGAGPALREAPERHHPSRHLSAQSDMGRHGDQRERYVTLRPGRSSPH
jgi:hypothetical protein